MTCTHLLLAQCISKAKFKDKVHLLLRTSKKPPLLPDCCVYSCDFTNYRGKLGWGKIMRGRGGRYLLNYY